MMANLTVKFSLQTKKGLLENVCILHNVKDSCLTKDFVMQELGPIVEGLLYEWGQPITNTKESNHG